MQLEQRIWSSQTQAWKTAKTFEQTVQPQLVLVFATASLIANEPLLNQVREWYPHSIITGCSTSGEIANGFIENESMVVTALYFEKSSILARTKQINDANESLDVGAKLIQQLPFEGLKHVLVLSEGLHINGTKLVEGMMQSLPKSISVTGGLAGDGADFKETFILHPETGAVKDLVVAVGIYGADFKVGYGSCGGWDIFGVERLVTKSVNNVLYEIDNAPALSLYKSFLGELATQLPSSGLLFPLSIRTVANEEPIVRTILAIDEATQSLTFAGDIPEGSYVKLMKANINHLVDGAHTAAERSRTTMGETEPEFALLVSCVGRKLVMKQMTEEEIEAVHDVLGLDTVLSGFYSYGEIAPFNKNGSCSLHNQTMTITTFSEK